ncbi:MAG: carbohydrate ABC transporter permease, partial [Clostridia bacterium]
MIKEWKSHMVCKPHHNSALKIGKIAWTLLFAFLGIAMILPFIWMLSTSFKSSQDVFKYPIEWIPSHFDFSHYTRVWTGKDSLVINYLNSIKTTVIPIVIASITGSLAAYGFTKMNFKGRDALFFLYISMMMIPPQILFI